MLDTLPWKCLAAKALSNKEVRLGVSELLQRFGQNSLASHLNATVVLLRDALSAK